jgi:hypothetical protein
LDWCWIVYRPYFYFVGFVILGGEGIVVCGNVSPFPLGRNLPPQVTGEGIDKTKDFVMVV